MILFKTPRQEKEFRELTTKNVRLYTVVRCLENFAELEFGKSLTVTDVLRTQAEHDAIYKNVTNPPQTSVHCFYEGIDLRSRDFTRKEIDRMVAFLNCFSFRNGKQTALYHEIPPHGAHFHLQVSK